MVGWWSGGRFWEGPGGLGGVFGVVLERFWACFGGKGGGWEGKGSGWEPMVGRLWLGWGACGSEVEVLERKPRKKHIVFIGFW